MNKHAYAMLLGIGIPTCMLFYGSVVLFSSRLRKNAGTLSFRGAAPPASPETSNTNQ